MRPLLLLASGLLILAAFSGCAAPATPAAASSEASFASPAVAGVDTGAIKGLVMDDSLAPVADAEIAILKTQHVTRSDAAGAFSFSGLAPGELQVVAQKTGFAQWGKKVPVAAGEITDLKIVMEPVVIETPHPEILPFVGIIHAGEAFLDIVTSTYAPQLCEKCRWSFKTPRTPCPW